MVLFAFFPARLEHGALRAEEGIKGPDESRARARDEVMGEGREKERDRESIQ